MKTKKKKNKHADIIETYKRLYHAYENILEENFINECIEDDYQVQ